MFLCSCVDNRLQILDNSGIKCSSGRARHPESLGQALIALNATTETDYALYASYHQLGSYCSIISKRTFSLGMAGMEETSTMMEM